MAPVLKTGIPERVSGVRIPPSPPASRQRTIKRTKRQTVTTLSGCFFSAESAPILFQHSQFCPHCFFLAPFTLRLGIHS